MRVLDVTESAFDAERIGVGLSIGHFCQRHLASVDGPVGEAILYALRGEGKRLRAILLLSAYKAVGGRGDASDLAAAVEVAHAYSLVHDDLPCMDDDDVRRGRPTVHRVYGIRAATCAGLAMVPLAARCAYAAARDLGLDEGRATTIVRELMTAAGAGGMIGGQLLDLEGEGHALTVSELERVHRAKTGALIAAAVRIGGIAARATASQLDALSHYGAAIGLAFQIADDVLDVTATTDQLGKTAGRDAALRKSTYPALLGVDGARSRAAALVEDACSALSQTALLSPALEHLARFIVDRQR
ncbi:MAG: polyprenyl synthetase family protein [Gemmatimonadaceae bacterium]